MTQTSYPAQIVFTQVDNVLGPQKWTGRLLRRSACVDVARRNRAVTWTPYFDITENPETGQCVVTMNGGSTPHSKRYANHRDVTAAQKAGIRWAARRFRIPVETPDTTRSSQ